MSGATYALPDGAPCPKCGNPLTGMMISSFCGSCDSRPKAKPVPDGRSWGNGGVTITQRGADATIKVLGQGVIRTYAGGSPAHVRAASRTGGFEDIEYHVGVASQRHEALEAWNAACDEARKFHNMQAAAAQVTP